jgi:hypothetical protein
MSCASSREPPRKMSDTNDERKLRSMLETYREKAGSEKQSHAVLNFSNWKVSGKKKHYIFKNPADREEKGRFGSLSRGTKIHEFMHDCLRLNEFKLQRARAEDALESFLKTNGMDGELNMWKVEFAGDGDTADAAAFVRQQNAPAPPMKFPFSLAGGKEEVERELKRVCVEMQEMYDDGIADICCKRLAELLAVVYGIAQVLLVQARGEVEKIRLRNMTDLGEYLAKKRRSRDEARSAAWNSAIPGPGIDVMLLEDEVEEPDEVSDMEDVEDDFPGDDSSSEGEPGGLVVPGAEDVVTAIPGS